MQEIIISIVIIIIIIIIISRHCTGHCSRDEHAPASSLSLSLSSRLLRPHVPRRRRVDSAISTGTTAPRVPCVRITHCTFTLGPGKTHVPPASLSLVAVSPLVPHSWLLPEMQNQIEIKKGKMKTKKLTGQTDREEKI